MGYFIFFSCISIRRKHFPILSYFCITDIGFVFQSMEELAKEDSSDATQEYDTDAHILDATVAGYIC